MRAQKRTAALAALAGTGIPSLAVAEVMDKEPSLGAIWAWALVGGCIGLVFWRFNLFAGLVATVGFGLFFASLIGEVLDPSVSVAIVREVGRGYFWQAYAAAGLCGLLHIVGASSRIQTKTRKFKLVGGRAGTIRVREGQRSGVLEWEMLAGDIDMVIYGDRCAWESPPEAMVRADVLRLAEEFSREARVRLEVAFADGTDARYHG